MRRATAKLKGMGNDQGIFRLIFRDPVGVVVDVVLFAIGMTFMAVRLAAAVALPFVIVWLAIIALG